MLEKAPYEVLCAGCNLWDVPEDRALAICVAAISAELSGAGNAESRAALTIPEGKYSTLTAAQRELAQLCLRKTCDGSSFKDPIRLRKE